MTERRPRIAIVKLSSLGDVIHALPVARALRRAMPEAHLTWVVEAREYAILRDHPDLDAVVPVDTRLWRRLIWRPAGAREVLGKVGRLRTRIRRAAFDVAIDLQGLIKSGLLTAYTGAPVRIGFSAARCRERLNALFTNRRVLAARLRAPRRRAILGSPRAARRRARLAGVRRSCARGGRAENGRAAPQGRRQAGRSARRHQPRRGPAEQALAGGAFSRPRRAARHGSGARLLVLWGPDEIAHGP